MLIYLIIAFFFELVYLGINLVKLLFWKFGSETVNATITELANKEETSKELILDYKVEFQHNGYTKSTYLTEKVADGTDSQYKIGQIVEVYYKENLEQIAIKKDKTKSIINNLILLGVSLGLIIILVFILSAMDM